MTVLVDPAIWWHRGRRWCHLVSDRDLEELHAFAQRLDLPVRAFHGDHYDVPEEWRDRVIVAGAVPVSSRELLAGLRRSGMRLTPASRRANGEAARAAREAAPPDPPT